MWGGGVGGRGRTGLGVGLSIGSGGGVGEGDVQVRLGDEVGLGVRGGTAGCWRWWLLTLAECGGKVGVGSGVSMVLAYCWVFGVGGRC